jgi:pseudomonalisin/xanthomonalisin
MLVSADGSAAAVKTAFNADVHSYNVNGRSAFANINDVSVPQSLSDVVLAVHGLQNVHLHHTMMAKPQTATLTVTGHNPTDFPAIYNASGLPSATNANIGIITQGSMTQTIADLNTFASNAGYPAPNVQIVTVGSASSDTSGIGEWNMDTQDALAAAGGTIHSMILYTANTLSDADLTSTYNRAVTDNVAKAINVSLGECENDAQSSGIMASNDQIFQTAVAQGQTFSVSSGDSGAYECGGPGTSQSYPSVSPYVISVGGTRVNANGTSYVSESVWSCTDATSCQQSAGGGGGGGPSLTESAPSWQTSAGVLGSSTMRGTPDIAFDADPSSGAQVLVNGASQQIGGTSLAAPIFTGFWARVQSANANGLAFPAAAIYQNAAAHPEMFHDVTTGSNGGYSAKTGWDYASGFGSLNVSNFAAVVGNNTPPPPPPPPSNVLSNGVPVTGLSMATSTQKVYTFSVPSGASSANFSTSGGSGDVDLYVKLGSAPTTSSYLQKSDGSTTSESIALSNPAAGTYYVLLDAYSAPSGFQVLASYSTSTGGGNALSSGVPVSNISGATGSNKYYTITVPAGRSSLTIKTSGGSGDADLYVQLGAQPTTSSYLKRSWNTGNTESITITAPAAGTYYVMLNGYAAYSGLTLTASW